MIVNAKRGFQPSGPMGGMRSHGFVLVTVLMVLILFTGASVTTLYAVTKNIKGTGYMRHRFETFEWAEGGLRTVFGDMCDHSLTQKTSNVNVLAEEFGLGEWQYKASLTDLRVVRRKVPGFHGELIGRDILIESQGWEVTTGKKGSIGEMLVFIARTQVTSGYGNE